MNPAELIAKMHSLAKPPSMEPFAAAAERAVIKAQTDLARFNTSSSTSMTVDASEQAVTVRWRTSRAPGRGSSRLSPSAAIQAHLRHEMAQARSQVSQDLGSRLQA